MKGAKKMKLYMIVAGYQNSIRNNFELVDFNLSKEQAENIKRNLVFSQKFDEIDEDWLIDEENGDLCIKIIEQAERI